MWFLQRDVLRHNVNAVVTALNGASDPATVRHEFLKRVRRLQEVPANVSPDTILFEWDNSEIVRFLQFHKLISEEESREDRHVVPVTDRERSLGVVRAGFAYVREHRPDIFDMIHELIGTISIFRLDEQDGGSVSSAIGYIYLSPKAHWTVAYCGEMLVHEFVHNSLFLIDMIEGLFPNLSNLALPVAAVTSVLRGQRRPYDKAFHSACVAATLIQFHSHAGNHERAAALYGPLVKTVDELFEVDRKCASEGVEIISDRVRFINEQLHAFVEQSARQFSA